MINVTTHKEYSCINYQQNNGNVVLNNYIEYIDEAQCQLSTFYTPDNKQLQNTKINILPLESNFLTNTKKIKNISVSINGSVSIASAKTVSSDNKYLAVITDSGIIKINRINSNNEHEELNIDFNSYNSKLSTESFKNFNAGDLMKFSHNSKNLIVFSDEHLTLLSLESENNWKVCSQLFMPEITTISEDETSYNYLNINTFNITDNNISIATLSSHTKYDYPITDTEFQDLTKLEKTSFLNEFPLNCRGVDRAIKYKFPDTTNQLKIFSSNLTNNTSAPELTAVSTIDIAEAPSEIKLSPDNNFLLVRSGIYLSIFSKNHDNLWELKQPVINIMEKYHGRTQESGFNDFPKNASCKFSDNSNRLLLRLGSDQIQVYTLTANKWEPIYVHAPVQDVKHEAISQDGKYIVVADYGKNISIFQEEVNDTKISYIYKESIQYNHLQYEISALNISNDQKYVIISQPIQATIYKIK